MPTNSDTLFTVRLSRINNLLLRFFLRQFRHAKHAQEYVHSRIKPDTAKLFYVGYAPPRGTIEYLNTHGVEEVDARTLGIANFDLEGNAFPKFYNRIMIPLLAGKRVVGFGGRALKNIEPKYLNSKESIVYKKREVLFGMQQARDSIIDRGCCFLVEGYFDVMTPYDYGLTNCVATCGTALTKQQVELMGRYTDKVYVMYDGDKAGRVATRKARKLLKKARIYAGRITLPGDLDPASYFEKYGKNGVSKLKRYLGK